MTVNLYPRPKSVKDKIEPYIPLLTILTILLFFFVVLGMMQVVDNTAYRMF